ncbi:MAG: ABC transporter substrate-binding protein, partial [Candidatus Saccharibacteria bacterium]|nr:ABC transporter substrate-binding protein [Rhodoferax sp.]
MKISKAVSLVLTAVAALAASVAHAVGPAPAPLAQKETLTVGFVKVGHLSPLLNIEEELKKFNVEVKRAEFVRYADARTALMSNSVDVSAVGPGDLAIAASQGSKNLVGLTGVGGSLKNLVVRKGVVINDWKDLAGKKIGIAPGSAVWFQWAMTMIEKNV